MQPDWTGIDTNSFPVKFGQILTFEFNSSVTKAIVLDFDKDKAGLWIGFCFISDNKLFGRQIPSGLLNTTCLDLFDLTYLKSDAIRNYQISDTLDINKQHVGIGAIYAVTDLNGLLEIYRQGIEKRKKLQTPCLQGKTDLNPVRECYFEIEKIIK